MIFIHIILLVEIDKYLYEKFFIQDIRIIIFYIIDKKYYYQKQFFYWLWNLFKLLYFKFIKYFLQILKKNVLNFF